MTRPLNPNQGKTHIKGSETDTTKGASNKGTEQLKKGQQPGSKDSLHSKGQGFNKPR